MGSYVWRWYLPAARGKLGKGWVGPFKMIKCPTRIHCIIQRTPQHPQIRVHIDALKPYYGPVPEAWTESSESQSESELSSSEDEPQVHRTTPDSSPGVEGSRALGRGFRKRRSPDKYSP